MIELKPHFYKRFLTQEQAHMGRRLLKRRITIATKLEIISLLEHSSSRNVARDYGVARSNVLRWKAQEAELRKLDRTACRLPGGGAKVVGEELHRALTEKTLFERAAQRRVTRSIISAWATSMKADMGLTISICPSWVDRFLQRAGFVLRKATRKPVLTDDELVARGVHFILDVRALVACHNISAENIYNLDETAVFFDHTKATTVHVRGAKDVPIRSHGFEKQRVTAVFCASATGKKMPPCIMSKMAPVAGEAPVKVVNGVMELRMGTAWMNASAFVAYLEALFPDPLVPDTTLLLFDSARCHIAREVQEYLRSRRILFAVVPGGMTGMCQPADFGWFAQLKHHLTDTINAWKRNGPLQYTRGGRVRPPSHALVAEWLSSVWSTVQPCTVRASFDRCVLGRDDGLHLSQHERLGRKFRLALRSADGSQQPLSLQHLLDEFDDLLVVDE